VVGFEVQHDFGECRQGQDVNVHEGLEHPAGGGALGGLALLVGHRYLHIFLGFPSETEFTGKGEIREGSKLLNGIFL